jgi:hypothetical protein
MRIEPDRGGATAAAARAARGRAVAAAVGLVVAVGLTLAPPAAAPVAAASGRLLVSSAATYTVDPAAGAVHVATEVTYHNDKPSDATFFYYWRDLSLAVHPEATAIAVRDPGGPLAVTPRARDGFIEAEFRLRRDLLFGQTITLSITWELPGGAPRSSSSVRVGEAFAAFDLWAWGDAGDSSVTAHLPPGFDVETSGSELEQTSTPDWVTLTAAGIADPDAFWAGLTATRQASMASDELTLGGDIRLTVRGWPEDTIWRTSVVRTLRRGLPALQELIGLPWPIDRRVDVSEVYSPLLEGYAGIFYTRQERIEISEDIDSLVIVHEAAHAWFNQRLFEDRWIDEGLADTFAAEVLVGMGEARQAPDRPAADDPGRIELLAWGAPGRITEETADVEAYGYNTSWHVVTELFEEVGPERLRAVFRAASDSTIAYRGEGDPESVRGPDDWRRFLDLLEEVGGSTAAEGLFREYVVTPAGADELDQRATARAAYAELVGAGDGWLPPIYVRDPMGAWSFARVQALIGEANDVLELREDVEDRATALDLEAGDALETAYETATQGFDEAVAVGRAELDALEILAEAAAALDAPPDILASIGLLGEEPAAAYGEAAAAYEAGDLTAAQVAAVAAVATVRDAPRLGSERLTVVAGIVIGTGVVIVVVVLVRRRRRPVAPATATALPEALAAVAPPTVHQALPAALTPALPEALPPAGTAFPIGPYGTLAADSPTPPPEADRAGDAEGGTADGEGSRATP